MRAPSIDIPPTCSLRDKLEWGSSDVCVGGCFVDPNPMAPMTLELIFPDTRAMEMVIRFGNEMAMRSLLSRSNAQQKQRMLSTKYGGRGDSKFPDDNGLFGESLPVLHAALTGKVEVFWAIVGAMKDNPAPNQVKAPRVI